MKRTPRQYAELLYAITAEVKKSEVASQVQRFVSFLVRERATQYVSRIITTFEEIWNENQAIQPVKVALSRPLPVDFSSLIEETLKDKKVLVEETIDPKLLGGIRIRLKDTIIDGTIHAQLEKLALSLRA